MIGSHNTFSYLPVSKWWMWLFTPWHKCQNKTVLTQMYYHKTEYLDIRVRFIDNEPVFVHNTIVYKTPGDSLNYLAYMMRYYAMSVKPFYNGDKLDRKIPFRLILDVMKLPKDYVRQIRLFFDLINKLQHEPYSNYLELDEARIYWDWDNPIIKSKYDIKELHTSVCSKWYHYILDTKWFARKYNKEIHRLNDCNKDKNTVYLMDFVNIGK